MTKAQTRPSYIKLWLAEAAIERAKEESGEAHDHLLDAAIDLIEEVLSTLPL